MEHKPEFEPDVDVVDPQARLMAQSDVETSLELTMGGKQKLHVASTKDGAAVGIQSGTAFTAEAAKDLVFVALAALAMRVKRGQPLPGAQDETEPQ